MSTLLCISSGDKVGLSSFRSRDFISNQNALFSSIDQPKHLSVPHLNVLLWSYKFFGEVEPMHVIEGRLPPPNLRMAWIPPNLQRAPQANEFSFGINNLKSPIYKKKIQNQRQTKTNNMEPRNRYTIKHNHNFGKTPMLNNKSALNSDFDTRSFKFQHYPPLYHVERFQNQEAEVWMLILYFRTYYRLYQNW